MSIAHTWYFREYPIVKPFGSASFVGLQDGGPPPNAAITSVDHSATGWATGGTTLANPFGNMRAFTDGGVWGNHSNVAAPTFIPFADSYRTPKPLNGSFAAGNWSCSLSVRAILAVGTVSGRALFRLWKSRDPNATGAIALSATTQGSDVTGLTTSTAQQSTASMTVSAFTLDDEYLFFQIQWVVTSPGDVNDGVRLLPGANSFITSTVFTRGNLVPPTFYFEADWLGAGFDSALGTDVNAYSDLQPDLIGEGQCAQCRRGRSYAAQAVAQAGAGSASVTLTNDHGWYSRWNSVSPLYRHLVPGIELRIRMTDPVDQILWTGRLKDPTFGFRAQTKGQVTLQFEGLMADLVDPWRVNPPISTGAKTGTLAASVLTAQGVPSWRQVIDPYCEVTTAAYAEDNVQPLAAIRRLETTEVGFFLEGADSYGARTLNFEGRGFRRYTTRSTTVQATFDDGGNYLPYASFTPGSPYRYVFDEVECTIEPFIPFSQDPVDVFNPFIPDRYHIILEPGPGYTRRFTVLFSAHDVALVFTTNLGDDRQGKPILVQTSVSGLAAYVDSWVTPTLTGTTLDIVPRSPATASDLVLAPVQNTPNSYTFDLTNNTDQVVTFSTFRVRGIPVFKQGAMKASAGSLPGRQYSLSGPWYASIQDAEAACAWIYNFFRTPRDVWNLGIDSWATEALAIQGASRQISDRIRTICAQDQISFDEQGYIEAISHSWENGARKWRTTFDVSGVNPNPQDGSSGTTAQVAENYLNWDQGNWDGNSVWY